MTDRIQNLYKALRSKEYRKARKPLPFPTVMRYNRLGPYDNREYMDLFSKILRAEEPLFFCDEDEIGFHLSYTNDSKGYSVGNYAPNYKRVISTGFAKMETEIRTRKAKTKDLKKRELADYMLESLSLGREAAEKYRRAAKESGRTRLYEALCRIPEEPAETFYEACVFISFCIYILRSVFTEHLTLGRFDQYMLSYYEHDFQNGVSREELFETLEAFFISLNVDTDLYHGIQTGDNGQSMVLAGFDEDGNYLYNELSEMCLKASGELKLIDPKINLRVGKNTPLSVFIEGTRLTKAGLGFPQYCNDDVVIPGLMKLGYDREDAYNYTVAACWEYIIPNVGADTPNISRLDFPRIIADATAQHLLESETYEEFFGHVSALVREKCLAFRLLENRGGWADLPLNMLFIDPCFEKLEGVFTGGAKYNNYGIHGPGIAVAADSLAAVKKLVFDEKTLSKETLLSALSENFEGYGDVRERLLSCPKMGNNDDSVDFIASALMREFSGALRGLKNIMGGIFRPGTGSAMEYVTTAKECPATPDGRRNGDVYPSSFSPSIGIKTAGLLSTIQSFTKFDMTEIINGGPLTVEVHDTVFRNEIGIEKTAELVKAFVTLGGHQLQINAVNRETLLDAKAHPELYPNLVVRVWGWSGYFVELAPEYQNHIIRRQEFAF